MSLWQDGRTRKYPIWRIRGDACSFHEGQLVLGGRLVRWSFFRSSASYSSYASVLKLLCPFIEVLFTPSVILIQVLTGQYNCSERAKCRKRLTQHLGQLCLHCQSAVCGAVRMLHLFQRATIIGVHGDSPSRPHQRGPRDPILAILDLQKTGLRDHRSAIPDLQKTDPQTQTLSRRTNSLLPGNQQTTLTSARHNVRHTPTHPRKITEALTTSSPRSRKITTSFRAVLARTVYDTKEATPPHSNPTDDMRTGKAPIRIVPSAPSNTRRDDRPSIVPDGLTDTKMNRHRLNAERRRNRADRSIS